MKQTLAFLSSTLLAASLSWAAGKTTMITKKVIKTDKPTTESTMPDVKMATLTISGMHCGGCKNMVTKKVCEDAALAPSFESCEVTNLDTKAQIGTMVIKYKKDATMDLDSVEKAIQAAGEGYTVTKKEVQEKITKTK